MEDMVETYNNLHEKYKLRFCIYLAQMSEIFVKKFGNDVLASYSKYLNLFSAEDVSKIYPINGGELIEFIEKEDMSEYSLLYLAEVRWKEYLVYNAVDILIGIPFYKDACYGIQGIEDIANLLDECLYNKRLDLNLPLKQIMGLIKRKDIFYLSKNIINELLDNIEKEAECKRYINDYQERIAVVLDEIIASAIEKPFPEVL